MGASHRMLASRAAGIDDAGGITVLKFGSSVLARPEDYTTAAEVIGAQVANGRKVVAVVSAMGGTTDFLLSAARSVTPVPSDTLVGALLATGEEASVALLSLALAARGVRAAGFSASRVPLRTIGALHDADPVFVDAGQIHAAFRTRDAVVFPGFIGVDMTGVASLLGRGGSDLTALFLGDALDAAEIRLIKDVDGIFPSDPRNDDALEPFPELTWEHARDIGGGVVQPKAIDFAERRGLRFRVTGLTGEGTSIGTRAGWPTPS